MIASDQAWKLALAVVLLAAIGVAIYARAPRRPAARADLRRLVFAAGLLYAVGLAASLAHRGALAAGVYAAGILVCALALWLSRGRYPGEGPGGGDDPGDEQPPPDPGGAPAIDWEAFERQFHEHVRDREPLRG